MIICTYPMAYAAVEWENYDSWFWFLELLKEGVGIQNDYGWSFMSNKQKGLIKTFEELVPNAENRFCFQHMHNNFANAGHQGQGLGELLWDYVTTTHPNMFKSYIEKLKKVNLSAADWLTDKPPRHWSWSHFSSYPKCDILTNNLRKSFNNLFKKNLSMLEDIRDLLMKRLTFNRTLCQKWWGEFCHNALERLEITKKKVGDA